MLLLNQITLFLLNVRNFIYVFIESMIFVVIIMYRYYVVLKWKESECDELLFLNLANFLFFIFINIIHGYLYKPADTSKFMDYPLNRYPHEYR